MEMLVTFALKSFLIAGATLGLLQLLKGRSAAERSMVAHLGLLALVLFPLFLWLGWWSARGRWRLPVLAGAFLALQAFAAAEFATWHWVA